MTERPVARPARLAGLRQALHNPVLIKELRGRMRGRRAFVVLSVFLALSALVALCIYWVARDSLSSNPFQAGSEIGKVLFLGIALVALIQVTIIVPAQAAAALSGERERETYDLLIVTLLPSWKIVLGKLMATLAYAVLLIVALVPLMALAFFFGGVTPLEVAIALVGLLATALMFGSIGILCSTVAKRTISANVFTQGLNAAISLGIPFVALLFGLWLEQGAGFERAQWVNSYAFVYIAGAILALNPFIALGYAEALLSEGETRLFYPFDGFPGRNAPLWIPAPWLAFVVMALLVSLLCIVAATVRLRRIPRPKRGAQG